MKRIQGLFLLVTSLWCLDIAAQTPTFQDCLGAIPVCSDSLIVNYNHNGTGNYSNEIANVATCYAPEQRSVWFTWTVQTGGVLRFAINPTNVNQDHDWTLFDMTNATCGQLSSSSGASSAMVRSNTWGVNGNNGPTGVSTPNGGTGTCNGPGTGNGPKWDADLNVSAGERYVLHVTNWTGSVYGFLLDFSQSTAVIYDNVPPEMDSISSSTECNAFDSLVVRFSENIKCDSTTTSDFALIGPGGNHTITSVTSPVCGQNGSYDIEYTIHFTPPVTQIGNYKLKVIPGANFIEDVCGNQDTSDSLEFYFGGLVEFDLTGTEPECKNLCTGSLHASPTLGTAPFSFNWNNSLAGDSTHSNVCAGTYIVTVTDDADCERIDTIIIDEPDLLVASVDTTYGVSCPGSQNCDGGAEASAIGGTPPYYYLWQSNEVLAEAIALCAGTNTVIVTDVNGCADTTDTEVWVPDSILTQGIGDTTICITNVAAILATSTGGTAPYSYVWTEGSPGGPIVSVNQSVSVNPEVTTDFYVTSSDLNGCIGDVSSVRVRVRPELDVDIPRPDTLCPYGENIITAYGLGGDSLYSYAWSNGVFGPEITVGPEISTWYVVTVSDYCGTPAYVDSIFQQVGGYPSIRPRIKAEDDSLCPGESIYLIANGFGGFGGPDEFRYAWSHTTDGNPIQFLQPNKTATYMVTVTDLCLSPAGIDTVTIHVDQLKVPEIEVVPTEACAENDVFIGINEPKSGYRYSWDMGDGEVQRSTSVDSFLLHKYSEVGCYDLNLNILSDFGCDWETKFPCAVKVLSQPTADFSHQPLNPSNLKPMLDFENQSRDAATWEWTFDSQMLIDVDSFSHEFSDFNDRYTVTLVVESDDGCLDTAIANLEYEIETVVYYPSSFTPNGDGDNDEFYIIGEGLGATDFELIIYDRWGRQIFGSNNPQRGWDGKRPDGTWMPAGVYGFNLRYRNNLGEIKLISDQVTVSKTGERTGLQ